MTFVSKVLVVLAVLVAGTACRNSGDAVPEGRWGGRNAELVVTGAGASARFKCGATGIIGQTLELGTGSAFDVPGSFSTPVLNIAVQPARYVGSVSGSDMTLALSISGQPAGTFQLRRGAEPAFDVCNF